MRRDTQRLLILAVAVLAGPPPSSAQEARPPAVRSATPPARTQAPANRTQPPVNDARVKQLLGLWEKKSAELKTLDVRIRRVDKSPEWGDEEFEGRAILQTPDLAWLDFKKVKVTDDGKRAVVPYERIICTGEEVWQYKSDVKQIRVFKLDKEDRQHAMEEGPLPFLFNMKAADAEARYFMSITRESPSYYVISVEPRLKIDREAFGKAFLQLNRQTYLPDRIFLFSPDGKSTKDFTLSDVRRNGPVSPENFKGQALPKPWTVERDPGETGKAPRPRNLGNRAPAAPVRGGGIRRQ